jgi:hypothetical protein
MLLAHAAFELLPGIGSVVDPAEQHRSCAGRWRLTPTTKLTDYTILQEKIVQAEPSYGPPLCVLGLIDAALGRKEERCVKACAPSNFCRWKKMRFSTYEII